MGRTNFPNGFSQRFQRVREKNPTAFSNVSNGLGEISQRLFSTPSTGKEKKPTAFPTPSTLSSTPPTGTQRVANGFSCSTENRCCTFSRERSHVQHKSALRLSNLFLERSVKQQAHYFSRLETRKIQLASCENRLETRFSKFSRIENRVSSRVSQLASDCQLTFERYCTASKTLQNSFKTTIR